MRTRGDLPAPPWGPGFLNLSGLAYRLERTFATLALVVLLFFWQPAKPPALSAVYLGLTVFWFLWPDRLAFIPIGLASRDGYGWPAWGPGLYNAGHSPLVCAAVIAAWSLATGGFEWPLLGCAAHITLDRTVGYHLRAATSPHRSDRVVAQV